jgi:hypothetical protein
MRIWRAYLAIVCLAVATTLVRSEQAADIGALTWYKGTTHIHTLNSDGDSTPDDAVRWYREQRYHFVVLTDHNTVTPVEGLNAVHGAPDRFLVIRGEEVSDVAGGKPVHLNLLGGDGLVQPRAGTSPADALQRDIDAMRAAHGLVQINHPNFRWALGARDLEQSRGGQLLEIFNGHPQVNNLGAGGQPSVEAMWDAMLSSGQTVYGVASDDMHDLKRPGTQQAAGPGRGWVVVHAAQLTEHHVLAALAAGAFYASTGVELSDVQIAQRSLTITIKEQSFARYTVSFIGKGGRVLQEAFTSPARYDFSGDEGYVRAKVLDSNGLMAWTQPIRVLPSVTSR